MRAVRSYSAPETKDLDRVRLAAGWRSLDGRSTLIDTRLVRAELARLRAPRPATEIHTARVTRSTLSGRS
jgi:hypothetical protein